MRDLSKRGVGILGLAMSLALVPMSARAEMGIDAPPPRPAPGPSAQLAPGWPAVELAPEDRPVTRTRWAPVVAGIAMFAGGWVLNLAASLPAGICGPSINVVPGGGRCVADPGWDGFRLAGAVPIVGPVVQLAMKPGRLDDDAWAAWLITDAVVQAVGLVTLVIGLTNPIQIAPVVGSDRAGLTIQGTF